MFGITKKKDKKSENERSAGEKEFNKGCHALNGFQGTGGEFFQDDRFAYECFVLAAKNNHPRAMFYLYMCLDQGRGVDENKSETLRSVHGHTEYVG